MYTSSQHYHLTLKGSVHKKWKGVWVYFVKQSMVITANLTSICCVYKEKIVKNDSYHVFRTQRPYKFRKLQYLTWIVKKLISNHSEILQLIIIDFFDAFVYSLYFIIFLISFFFKDISLALDFRTFIENMKMSSSLQKSSKQE